MKKSMAAAYMDQKKSEKRRKMWAGGEVGDTEMSEKDVEEEYEEHSNHAHNEFCPEGCEWGDDEEVIK